jgi:hypothetical protein
MDILGEDESNRFLAVKLLKARLNSGDGAGSQ